MNEKKHSKQIYHKTKYSPTLFFKHFEELAIQPEIANSPALFFHNISYTYHSLNEKINQLAHYLLKIGQEKSFDKESRIAVFLEPSDFSIITILAIMKAGFVYVPLNTPSNVKEYEPSERLTNCINNCEPKLIVSSKNLSTLLAKEKFSYRDCTLLQLDQITNELNKQSKENPNTIVELNQLAYIIYTSGTSGEPKGVAIEHEGLYHRLWAHQNVMNISNEDKIVQNAPPIFDANLMELMLALGSGASLHILPQNIQLDDEKITEFYESQQISITILTPSKLKVLDPNRFQKLRIIISTGEKIDSFTMLKWYKILEKNFGLFINGYGPSELTICTTLGICNEKTKISIGDAIPNLELFIFEENFDKNSSPKLVKDGQRGELYIGGVGIARQYWGDNENIRKLNQERFLTIQHPHYPEEKIRIFKTCDAVVRNDDTHTLDYVERLDRQVKIYGKLVCPEEIDRVIKEAEPENIDFAHADIKISDTGHPQITAYLILTNKLFIVDFFELYRKIVQRLGQTMVPQNWTVIDKKIFNQCLSPSNKLDSQKLAKHTNLKLSHLCTTNLNFKHNEYNFQEKKLITELLSLWRKILSIDTSYNLCINDNFLHLGGTSLQCSSLLIEINQIFKKFSVKNSYSITDFLKNPTIASILKYYQCSNLNQDEWLSLEQIHPDYPLKKYESGPTPLFLIHTLLGDPQTDYDHLVKLWHDRPIYGIKCRSHKNADDLPNNIVEIASEYIVAIKKLQSSGIYLLAAWSTGGIICYEMAKQLQSSGKQVAIFSIDTIFPTLLQNMNRATFANYLYNLFKTAILPRIHLRDIVLTENQLAYLPKLLQIERIISVCYKSIQTGENIISSEKLLTTVYGLLSASIIYQVLSQVTNINLLITKKSQEDFKDIRIGWPKNIYIDNIIELEGDHFSVLRENEPLKKLIAELKKFCDSQEIIFKLQPIINNLKTTYINKKNSHLLTLDGKLLSFSDNFVMPSLITQDSNSISLTSFFEKNELKHIGIYGSLGSGNSTLCQFIVSEWANEKIWQNKFKIVFYFKNGKFLFSQDHFQENSPFISNREKIENQPIIDTIKNCLKYIPDSILFIIDDLDDENNDSSYKSVFDYLFNRNDTYIIATTKTKFIPGMDQYVENHGIAFEKLSDYFETYLKNDKEKSKKIDNFKKIISSLLKQSEELKKLIHLPLVLNIIYFSLENKLNFINDISSNHLATLILQKLYASKKLSNNSYLLELFSNRYFYKFLEDFIITLDTQYLAKKNIFSIKFWQNNIKEVVPQIFNVPIANENFTGRLSILQELEQMLCFPGIQKAFLYGPGGIGKSQLAKIFAHKNKLKYSIIRWFDASKDIDEQYYQLACELHEKKILNKSIIIKGISYEEVSTKVKDFLRSYKNWLLIFDNVVNLSTIEQYFPEQHTDNFGHILMTSRNSNGDFFEKIKVKKFTPEEANNFIKKSLTEDIDSIEQLAKILYFFPLAIAQAISYIKKNQISIPIYLERYQKSNLTDLLNESSPNSKILDKYQTTLRYVFEMSLKELDDHSLKVLQFMALLHCQSISYDLIKNYPEFFDINLSKALEQLEQYSIVTKIIEKDYQQSILKYEMHELIRDFVLNLPESFNETNPYFKSIDNFKIKKLLAYIDIQFDYSIYSRKTNDKHLQLISHVLAALHHAEKRTIFIDDFFSLCLKGGIYYACHSGNIVTASNLFEKILINYPENTPKPELLLHSYAYIAYSYLEKADEKKAIHYCEKSIIESQNPLINIKDRCFVQSSALGTLGHIFRSIHELETAQNLYQLSYDLLQRADLLLHASSEVSSIFFSQAEIAYSNKQYDQAEKLYQKAKKISGEIDTAETIFIDCGLADIALKNNIDLGIERYLLIIEKQKKIYGYEKHNQIASSYCRLGLRLNESEQYIAAIPYFLECYKIRMDIYKTDKHHDFNNMLKGIIKSLNFLKEKNINPSQHGINCESLSYYENIFLEIPKFDNNSINIESMKEIDIKKLTDIVKKTLLELNTFIIQPLTKLSIFGKIVEKNYNPDEYLTLRK